MMVFEGVGFVLAPSPVPEGSSILSAVKVSPEPATKVASTLVDCPMSTEVELAVMVALGDAGGVTVKVAGHVPEPPEPETEPP